LALLSLLTLCSSALAAHKPNILFILVDDLGWRDLGCYGHEIEALKANSYRTGLVGKWHLGEEPYYPERQGFDVNVAGCSLGAPGPGGYFSPYNISEVLPAFTDGPKGEYLTDRLTTEAIRLMDDFSKKAKPWLLYMSYHTVHAPIHAKVEKIEKYKRKYSQVEERKARAAVPYATMMESLDENVGHLLQWLDEKELQEHTIIVFTRTGARNSTT
jgi:arylsulfatase A-like enzyme